MLAVVGLLAVSALLAGCGGGRVEELVFEPEDEQELRVVWAYEGQARYLEEARSDPSADHEALWREYVVEAYREDCFAGEYEGFALERFSEPVWGFERLSEALEELRGSEEEVGRVVEGALRKSARELAGPDTTVCVLAADDRQADFSYGEGTSVGGFAAGSGRILLSLDPEGDWREWAPYVTAHEYHHSVWTDARTASHPGAEQLELVDYLAFEGRAEAFARLVYHEKEWPATWELSPEEEAKQWEAMREDLASEDLAPWRRYAFGGGDTPPATLYAIGLHVVEGYLQRHPDQDVEAWTALDARELLEESGYEGEAPQT